MNKRILYCTISLLLTIMLCMSLTSCGDDVKPTAKEVNSSESVKEVHLITQDKLKSLFSAVTLTNDNLYDYFEITCDDECFWLSPKENVLSYFSTNPAQGLNIEYSFDCTYKVNIIKEGGKLVPADNITRTEHNNCVNNSVSAVKIWTAKERKVVDADPQYIMKPVEITNFTVTDISQAPYSLCVLNDITPYCNDINGERVFLYEVKMEGPAAESTFCKGFTLSGKVIDLPVMLEKKNGKYYLGNSQISYSSDSNNENYTQNGNNGWFPLLYESEFMQHN